MSSTKMSTSPRSGANPNMPPCGPGQNARCTDQVHNRILTAMFPDRGRRELTIEHRVGHEARSEDEGQRKHKAKVGDGGTSLMNWVAYREPGSRRVNWGKCEEIQALSTSTPLRPINGHTLNIKYLGI